MAFWIEFVLRGLAAVVILSALSILGVWPMG